MLANLMCIMLTYKIEQIMTKSDFLGKLFILGVAFRIENVIPDQLVKKKIFMTFPKTTIPVLKIPYYKTVLPSSNSSDTSIRAR